MSARKPTKSERAAKRKAKELAAKRDKRQPLSDLDVWAVLVHETWLAMQRQGFTKEQAMKKYGTVNSTVLAVMKQKCDFNNEHNGFDWTGEYKIHQIMEDTGLTEQEVKDGLQWLLNHSFISQYKDFEVYSINIKL